jgi:hypothetical protein
MPTDWVRGNMAPLTCVYGFGPSGSISEYGPDPRANDIVVCDVNNPNPRALKLTRWELADIDVGLTFEIVGPAQQFRVLYLHWSGAVEMNSRGRSSLVSDDSQISRGV